MIGAVPRRDQIEATNVDLWGLYNVLRSSYLNILYYGRRASVSSSWNFWLQLGAAIGSLGSVTGFLASQTSIAGQHELAWRILSALVGACSGISAALPALMGLSDKINKLERLHFAYCEVFHLAQRTAMDVRREGFVTEELRGAIKLLCDLYSRLGQMDDPDFNKELRDKYEIQVKDKYPDGSLWYASADGNQTAESETHPSTA